MLFKNQIPFGFRLLFPSVFLYVFFSLLVDEKVTSIKVATAKVQANSIQTNIELLLATPNQYSFRIDIRIFSYILQAVDASTMFTNGFGQNGKFVLYDFLSNSSYHSTM